MNSIILAILACARLAYGETTSGDHVNVGDYIRAGLGITTDIVATNVTMTATISSSTLPNATIPYSALNQCAESLSSYSAFESSARSFTSTPSIVWNVSTTDLTYGAASDVYTTSAGVAVASGSFMPTKVVQTIVNVTSTTYSTVYTTLLTTASPSCTVSPQDCSLLYVSYISSLGLPYNATVPQITPAPSNSPACPSYYYQPFSTCSRWIDPVNTCWVSGESVELFYFPPQTAASGNTTGAPKLTVQSYAPGITFTYPSIYLSFNYLSAISSIGALEWSCQECDSTGCRASAVGGGDGFASQGTVVSGALISMAPEQVSTLLVQYNDTESASNIANVIAQGLEGYPNAVNEILSPTSFMPMRLNLDSLVHPAPTDYYLRPDGAPGCNNSIPSPECSTIFEGEYRPILQLPSEVSGLQDAWKTCIPALYVTDPPRALTQASTIDGASVPGASSTTSLSTTTHSTSYQAVPVTTASPPTPSATSHTEPPVTQPNSPSPPEVTWQSSGQPSQSGGQSTSPGSGSSDAGLSSVMTFEVGTQTYTVEPPPPAGTIALINGSQLLTIGGAEETLDGAIVSAASSGIVFYGDGGGRGGGETGTILYPAPQTTEESAGEVVFTAASLKITAIQAGPSGVVSVDGTVISAGGSAITYGGAAYSAASNGIVVDGSNGEKSTILYLSSSQTSEESGGEAVFTAAFQTMTAVQAGSGGLVSVDGTVITAGEAAFTRDGATYSAVSNGIVVDGNTVSFTAASSPRSVASASQGDSSGSGSAGLSSVSSTSTSGASSWGGEERLWAAISALAVAWMLR